MLPECQFSRTNYLSIRDYQSRFRKDMFRCLGGDADAFRDYILHWIAIEASVAAVREVIDWAEGEEMLTPEIKDAAENCILWGERLRKLALASRKAEVA